MEHWETSRSVCQNGNPITKERAVDNKQESDLVFAGSVPQVYDRLLVPLIFEEPAQDVVDRLTALGSTNVLEVAAGSGVLTRAMAAGLDPSVKITATDLNRPMIDHAASVGTSRPVTWQFADVMDLPFDDGQFDAVVCQFGVMFFPDYAGAYAEIARVLRPGGTFIFNVWDRIENNEFADVVSTAVAQMWPDDPPAFLARTPHTYYDETEIRGDLTAGGFDAAVSFEPLEFRSKAASCDIPAVAYCQGTPLRNEIEARDPARLVEATEVATAALLNRFGPTDLDSKIREFVVTAPKPM